MDWRPKHPRIVALAGVLGAVGVVLSVVLVALRLAAGRGAGEEAAVQPTVPVSGETAVRGVQPRIVGGRPANIAEVPFLASFGTSTEHACHGSLVAPQYVATTAECITMVPKWTKVTFLRTNLDDEGVGETRKIADYRTHPDWDGNDPIMTWAHNEAVVKLDQPISNIKPVCLAEQGSIFPTGANATVYGFGRVGTSEALPAPRTLQAVNVTVVDHDECNRFHLGKVTDDMICAGNDAGGQDICHGDGGAPLLVKVGDDHILLGSNIRGPKECGAPNSPGVHLNHDTTFLTDAIKQMSDPEPTPCPPPTPCPCPCPGPVCGIKNSAPLECYTGGRVENGQEVYPPHAYPWMAWTETYALYFMGGATLIHESFVLTRHAKFGHMVHLGAHDRSSTTEDTQRIRIKQTFRHPSRRGPTLARLSRPVKLTRNVQPICLPDPASQLPAGTTYKIAGWGGGEEWGKERLYEGSVTSITNQQCSEASDQGVIPKDVICTAVSETRPSWKDSGGPLMHVNKDNVHFLHGVQFDSGADDEYDDEPVEPARFWKVHEYLPWINSVLFPQSPAPTPEPSSGICFKKYEG